jgi:hypothetical protein
MEPEMSHGLINGGRRMMWAAALVLGCGGAATAGEIMVYANNPSTGDSFTNPYGPLATYLEASQAIGTSDWSYSEVLLGGEVGIRSDYARDGNGSVYFNTTGATTPFGGRANKASVGIDFGATLGTLADLTEFGYDWYRSSGGSASQAPVLRLALSDGHFLIWEPVYNGYRDNNSTMPNNTWTVTDALADGKDNFWYSGDRNNPTNPLPPTGSPRQKPYRYMSLADWLADGTVANLGILGMNAGVGSSSGLVVNGAVDNLRIGFNGAEATVYNFEVSPAAVPEPTSVAMGLIAGVAGLVMAARRRRAS